jgi:uncharacterized hydrophobic protein (TIGR00271 family)
VLVQLRIATPADRTAQVRELVEDCRGVAHLAVLSGASVFPAGDLVVVEVVRESADELINGLRDLGMDQDGAISIDGVDATVSVRAEKAEKDAPGDGSDAVVWEQVIGTVAGDSVLSVSYLTFLTIATLLASIAIVTDSAVLVVGAMVLGPEFTPLAGIALGAVHRRLALARTGAVSVVVGFAVAIALATGAALLARAVGWVGPGTLTADRSQTGFITSPDKWSLVVAVLAGIAGTLSLTAAKSSALVGVFISVTTVPAAGALALGLAFGSGAAIGEAGTQLGVNLVGILLAAVATLLLQRALWRRAPSVLPRADRLAGSRGRPLRTPGGGSPRG